MLILFYYTTRWGVYSFALLARGVLQVGQIAGLFASRPGSLQVHIGFAFPFAAQSAFKLSMSEKQIITFDQFKLHSLEVEYVLFCHVVFFQIIGSRIDVIARTPVSLRQPTVTIITLCAFD